MNLAEMLINAARHSPGLPALALGEKMLFDYRTLERRVARLAGGLKRLLGLEADARVAIVMRNVPEYVEAMYACWHAGLAAVPVNAKLHPREIAYILENSGARVCLATAELAAAVDSLQPRPAALERIIEVGSADYAALLGAEALPPAECSGDETAWLFYTSGTTGRPKGVMLSHRNLVTAALCYFTDVDGIAPGDGIIHAAPMSHGSGLYVVPHVAKAACNIVPESGGFDAAEICRLVNAHRGVTMFYAPTMVRRLLDHPGLKEADLARLKTIVYGGAPMYLADLKEALATLGNRLVQIYGQGESPMTITCLTRRHHAESGHPRYEQHLASAGTAYTGMEVRIADTDDRPLAVGELGEVLVRGDCVMKGYWQNPEATADALRGGWLHTGDVGVLDEEGFLTLKDRSKDLIISGGSNIYPREVEEVLLMHPRVHEVSVVGRAHPDWGEEVVAFVVAAAGERVGAEELDRLCLDNIARFKRPKEYRFVEALPKNNYGKILKTELRERLKAESESAASPPPR
ncbi:MAG TPA: AMP-binding protein [Alphaproteobacteria bacterium]|nr:AMP-binding protein [Alphaproteobacteria bacterium]